MIFKKFKIFLEYAFYIIQQVDERLNINLDTIERVTMIAAFMVDLVTQDGNCYLCLELQLTFIIIKRKRKRKIEC